MAFSHGKSSVIAVDDSSGTPTTITSYVEEVSWPQEVEASEVTTFGNGNKAYIVGLADSTVSLSGKYDPTLDALMTSVRAALIAGTVTTSTVKYSPAGTGSGMPYYSAEAILTSYEPSSSVADPNSWSAEYQVTGAVSRSTY